MDNQGSTVSDFLELLLSVMSLSVFACVCACVRVCVLAYEAIYYSIAGFYRETFILISEGPISLKFDKLLLLSHD